MSRVRTAMIALIGLLLAAVIELVGFAVFAVVDLSTNAPCVGDYNDACAANPQPHELQSQVIGLGLGVAVFAGATLLVSGLVRRAGSRDRDIDGHRLWALSAALAAFPILVAILVPRIDVLKAAWPVTVPALAIAFAVSWAAQIHPQS